MRSDGAVADFWEHAFSLRRHIVWGGLAFIGAAIVIFSYAADTLIAYLLEPLKGEELVFLSPLGPFFFKIRISLYAALGVSLPVWLALLLHFVYPALPARKRVTSLMFVVLSGLLSVGALAATYFYLVPTTLAFLMSFVVPGTSFLLAADSYVEFFLLQLAVAFVVLQLPLVIVLLAHLRLVSPHMLASKRHLVYPALLALLAVITPTPDAVTLLAVSVPAVLLLEVGLIAAKRVYGS